MQYIQIHARYDQIHTDTYSYIQIHTDTYAHTDTHMILTDTSDTDRYIHNTTDTYRYNLLRYRQIHTRYIQPVSGMHLYASVRICMYHVCICAAKLARRLGKDIYIQVQAKTYRYRQDTEMRYRQIHTNTYR
jgi:hypothetical protein